MSQPSSEALSLENRLRRHYRNERSRATCAEHADSTPAKQDLARLMAHEAAKKPSRLQPSPSATPASSPGKRGSSTPPRGARGDEKAVAPAAFQPISHACFVARQARFVHPATWAAQILLLAFAALACLSDAATSSRLLLAASLFGAVTAAIGLPNLARSKSQGLVELEYACRFNCAYVLAARLIVIGCANAAALSCCCIVMPAIAHTSLPDVAARVCTPYFLTCAGAMLITRRTRSDSALLFSTLWAAGVIVAAYAALLIAPQLYDATSTWLWSIAATAAIAWTVRETCLLMRCAARGLDALCPSARPGRSL